MSLPKRMVSNALETFERTGRTEIGHRSFLEVTELVFRIGHIRATFQAAGKCLWLS